jgi:hypothetical protein
MYVNVSKKNSDVSKENIKNNNASSMDNNSF